MQTASFVVLFPGKEGQKPSMRFDIGSVRVGAFAPKMSVDFLKQNFARKVKAETGTVFYQSKGELLISHGEVRRGSKNPEALFVSVTEVAELPPLSNKDLDEAFAEVDPPKPQPEEPANPDAAEKADPADSAESDF